MVIAVLNKAYGSWKENKEIINLNDEELKEVAGHALREYGQYSFATKCSGTNKLIGWCGGAVKEILQSNY